MDLEDAPQKSQSSRLPADTPVTKAMAPLLPPQPAHPPPHEPRTPIRPAIRSTDKGDG